MDARELETLSEAVRAVLAGQSVPVVQAVLLTVLSGVFEAQGRDRACPEGLREYIAATAGLRGMCVAIATETDAAVAH